MDKTEILSIVDCPNSIGDQVVNSMIMAGNAFFGTLIGIIGATQTVPTNWKLSLIQAGISAGFTFFSTLAIQRGLKRSEEAVPEA